MNTFVHAAHPWHIHLGISRYLKQIRPYIVWSIAIYAIGIILGAVSLAYIPSWRHELEVQIDQVSSLIQSLAPFQIFYVIFINNIVKILATILLGVFAGVYPFFALIVNGFVVGAVGYVAVVEQGIGAFLASIVPHGIFELPAFFIAAGIGLMLGRTILRRIFLKEKIDFMQDLTHGMQVGMLILFPLILIGAWVESYVTPIFAGIAAVM